MSTIKVHAIRFEQNGRVFYTAVIPVGELIDRSRVDVWSADASPEKVGYQRAPSSVRLRQVANYLEKDGAIMPVGGLVNARAEAENQYGEVLEFAPETQDGNGIASGWLSIPDSATPLWIVDMQHRLGGFGIAVHSDGRDDLAEFPVVVTIADGLSKMEEIEQFELINTTQKKVRTDLARRLMAIQAQDTDRRLEIDRRGKLWEARGPIVTEWLNKNGTTWKAMIIPPNKSKREMPKGIVRETSFVTSLKPILQTPLFQRMNEEQVAVLIDRYWQAIARMFPAAFASPNEYVIQKTTGVFSLNSLFPEVVELVRSGPGDLTVDNLEKAIDPWRDLSEDFWEAGNPEGAATYGGMKGFSLLAAELRQKLPQLDFELE